jgi:hypothetical protein
MQRESELYCSWKYNKFPPWTSSTAEITGGRVKTWFIGNQWSGRAAGLHYTACTAIWLLWSQLMPEVILLTGTIKGRPCNSTCRWVWCKIRIKSRFKDAISAVLVETNHLKIGKKELLHQASTHFAFCSDDG